MDARVWWQHNKWVKSHPVFAFQVEHDILRQSSSTQKARDAAAHHGASGMIMTTLSSRDAADDRQQIDAASDALLDFDDLDLDALEDLCLQD